MSTFSVLITWKLFILFDLIWFSTVLWFLRLWLHTHLLSGVQMLNLITKLEDKIQFLQHERREALHMIYSMWEMNKRFNLFVHPVRKKGPWGNLRTSVKALWVPDVWIYPQKSCRFTRTWTWSCPREGCADVTLREDVDLHLLIMRFINLMRQMRKHRSLQASCPFKQTLYLSVYLSICLIPLSV